MQEEIEKITINNKKMDREDIAEAEGMNMSGIYDETLENLTVEDFKEEKIDKMSDDYLMWSYEEISNSINRMGENSTSEMDKLYCDIKTELEKRLNNQDINNFKKRLVEEINKIAINDKGWINKIETLELINNYGNK